MLPPPAEKRQNFFGVFLQFHIGVDTRRAGVKEAVFMSGGVARNAGVRKALEDGLGVTLHTSELSQLAGALGAAIYGFQKMSR